MQITVINLASQTGRWFESVRQFNALGLKAVRRDAVDGRALKEEQIRTLYSEQLNIRQYHQPLRAGEIGCYASHLAAWQRLLESGDEAMAVFEDDLEIDAGLPAVLSSLTAAAVQADVVKLIGRPAEKIRASIPINEGLAAHDRRLIAYRRVPSLTGAYVVTREGARKLLAARRPFGRPVDVDLRHWWECGLRVLGVHPYPVKGAPSAEVSTIGSREKPNCADRRFKKLFHAGPLHGRQLVGNAGGAIAVRCPPSVCADSAAPLAAEPDGERWAGAPCGPAPQPDHRPGRRCIAASALAGSADA